MWRAVHPIPNLQFHLVGYKPVIGLGRAGSFLVSWLRILPFDHSAAALLSYSRILCRVGGWCQLARATLDPKLAPHGARLWSSAPLRSSRLRAGGLQLRDEHRRAPTGPAIQPRPVAEDAARCVNWRAASTGFAPSPTGRYHDGPTDVESSDGVRVGQPHCTGEGHHGKHLRGTPAWRGRACGGGAVRGASGARRDGLFGRPFQACPFGGVGNRLEMSG